MTFQLIASSSLYLAGKIKDDPIKIRDIINVAHNTLNRGLFATNVFKLLPNLIFIFTLI